jgi:CheY-like chemotaxis protein
MSAISPPFTGNPSILLVEDDPMVRETIALMLEGACDTVVAASVGMAMAHLQGADRAGIDCILLDCLLPDGNLARIVAEAERQAIPIVFISGDPSQVERLPPAHEFLPKPFTQTRLLAAIKSAAG